MSKDLINKEIGKMLLVSNLMSGALIGAIGNLQAVVERSGIKVDSEYDSEMELLARKYDLLVKINKEIQELLYPELMKDLHLEKLGENFRKYLEIVKEEGLKYGYLPDQISIFGADND